jgi:hypothetical protein
MPSHRGAVGQRQADLHGVLDCGGAADVDAIPKEPTKDLPKRRNASHGLVTQGVIMENHGEPHPIGP